ncbi:hypothetical protein BDN70DRAFT_560316 [Pholiota conissans]|uniref:Uncharacterized protein n=1 Tax=Pholiota conissans TaxID=109636 RepID=A0A9P5Z6P9_9AGAR|nr:hypothetical protein BDN70DRAFT_560316 [Pholiota conissans]
MSVCSESVSESGHCASGWVGGAPPRLMDAMLLDQATIWLCQYHGRLDCQMRAGVSGDFKLKALYM